MVAENTSKMTIKQALDAVIKHSPNPYAKQYAEAIRRSYEEYGHHGVKVQILYVLSNILDIDKKEEIDLYWEDCELKTRVIETLENYQEGDWTP